MCEGICGTPGTWVLKLGNRMPCAVWLDMGKYYGYEENINIEEGNCHGCHCLYDGFDVCAKGMEKPECMWGITPEMVMERVEEYMERII